MPIELLLVQGGVVAAIMASALALVRIAVAAERRRADDWREAYTNEVERGDVREAQLVEIMAALRNGART